MQQFTANNLSDVSAFLAELELGRVLVMGPESREYKRSFDLIRIKQDGLCRLCKQIVAFGQIFVSHGSRRTKYYHEGCARKVKLYYPGASVLT